MRIKTKNWESCKWHKTAKIIDNDGNVLPCLLVVTSPPITHIAGSQSVPNCHWCVYIDPGPWEALETIQGEAPTIERAKRYAEKALRNYVKRMEREQSKP